MKGWAITVIVAAIVGSIASLLLPKGDKSPLYKPLRFLSALILLILLCDPFLRLVKDPNALLDTGFATADEALIYDPGKLLLTQSEEYIEKRVRQAFPEGDYTLVFETNEERDTILAIRVETHDAALGNRIADWLKDNGMAAF